MPISFVAIQDKSFAALILPDPGWRTLRFLFLYAGAFRAMSWLMIGSDGSLYLNPRRKPSQPMFHGTGVADGAGGMRDVAWTGQDAPGEVNRKVPYHPSGIVKGGSRMSRGLPLREIKTPTLIRQDDYAHPSKFQVVEPSSVRQTDIVIPRVNGEPFELVDERALTSRIFVAPLRDGNANVTIIDDDPNACESQTAVVVPAVKLKGCQDLTYQILDLH